MTLQTIITETEESALKSAGCTIFRSLLGVLYIFDKENNRIEFREQILKFT